MSPLSANSKARDLIVHNLKSVWRGSLDQETVYAYKGKIFILPISYWLFKYPRDFIKPKHFYNVERKVRKLGNDNLYHSI